MSLLKVVDATKRFGSLTAIEDVSLTIDAGRTARHHRPQRRRQDDVLQSGQRALLADGGTDPV